MLTITETAAMAITKLIFDSPLAEGAGLRIASSPEEAGVLQLSLAPAPSEQDTVVENAGAAVFLEPTAAQVLDDRVLDVQRVVDGGEDQYQFAITPKS